MASEPKSPAKTLKNGLIPGNPGNSGGKKGRSGRKPKDLVEYYRQRCLQIAQDPTVWDVQLARAKSGDHKALDRALDRAYGPVKQDVSVEGDIIIRVVRED